MKIDNLNKTMTIIKKLSPKDFDMNLYQTSNDTAPCGSIGCIIGHVARVEGVPAEFKNFYGGTEFKEWSEHFFDIPSTSNEWAWAFSHLWSTVDNSLSGATARIKYLIVHGKAPENARAMVRGLSNKEYLDIVNKYKQLKANL